MPEPNAPDAIASPGRSAVRIAVMGRGRGRVHLDVGAVGWESSASQVRAAITKYPSASAWMIAGGEPTLWADLPEAIEILALAGLQAGVVSDGWLLAEPRVTKHLAGRGLRHVVIQLHAARSDAHDWITGIGGSARRAVAAVRVCQDAGLHVGGEIWLTKPGVAHLVDTVGLLVRLGVKTITLRRLVASQVEARDVLGLLPRLMPSVRFLTAAARAARNTGATLVAAGLPACLMALCRTSGLRSAEDVWIVAEGVGAPIVAHAGPGGLVACDACAGRISCRGAPADHVASFGAFELEVMQARVRAGEAA